MKRQELDMVSARREKYKKKHLRKKERFLTLKGSSGTFFIEEVFLRYGMIWIRAFSLMFFLLFCSSDIPYGKMRIVSFSGLRRLEIPDASLEQIDIKVLKADAGINIPKERENQKVQLWDIPHFPYTINARDTISQISRQYHVSISTLLSLNKIDNVKKLSQGQTIIVPEEEGILYVSGREDSLENIADRFSMDSGELLQFNPYIELVNGAFLIHPGQELFIPGAAMPEQQLREQMGELFIFPVQGHVLKGYGNVADDVTQIETFHNGIDIKGDRGDAVKASLDGRVIAAGFNSSYGNYIILEHSGGYRSLYAQLEETLVEKNDKVLQGEMIAEVGSSGYARVPHLHFSLFKGKKSIDPLDYLH